MWLLVSVFWWIVFFCIGYFMFYLLGFDKVFNISWFEDFVYWYYIDIFSFLSWYVLILFLVLIYLVWCVINIIFVRIK